MNRSLALAHPFDFKTIRWSRVAWVSVGWISVGLFSGFQLFLTKQAGGLSLAAVLFLQVLHALPWIAVTFIAACLVHAFPLHPRTHRWRNGWVHFGAGVLVVLGVNLAQGILRVLFGFTPIAVFSPVVLQGLLMWGHFAFVVYGTLVLGWSFLLRSRPPQSIASEAPNYLQSLPVSKGAYNTSVKASEIDWIEGARDYVLVHSNGVAYMATERMNGLEHDLDPAQFARIHRSTIVNLHRVVAFKPQSHGDYELKLEDGTALKLTRTRREAVLALLEKRFNNGAV